LNVTVFGVGKLGLCFSLSLERAGFHVLGVDKNASYVLELNQKTFQSLEPFVSQQLKESQNFRATTSVEEGFHFADLLITFVSTPSQADHRFDHSQIESILTNFQPVAQRKDFVIGATVMPKTCAGLQTQLEGKNIFVSYSPSFIAQGNVFNGIERPDFVLVGEADEMAGDLLTSMYGRICKNNPPIHRMSRQSAELTKLALNCFITSKITFANTIGDIAQQLGAEPAAILEAIGSDSRVGKKYFQYGAGFGGPCFPRDNRALSRVAEDLNIGAELFQATDLANQKHLEFQVQNFVQAHGEGGSFTVGPVSYNANTVSIEESQQLEFAVRLAKLGYLITIEDKSEVLDLVEAKYPGMFILTRGGEERCLKDQRLSVGPVDSSAITSFVG
jgi:UDPglucose 6-dehydrogenase